MGATLSKRKKLGNYLEYNLCSVQYSSLIAYYLRTTFCIQNIFYFRHSVSVISAGLGRTHSLFTFRLQVAGYLQDSTTIQHTNKRKVHLSTILWYLPNIGASVSGLLFSISCAIFVRYKSFQPRKLCHHVMLPKNICQLEQSRRMVLIESASALHFYKLLWLLHWIRKDFWCY